MHGLKEQVPVWKFAFIKIFAGFKRYVEIQLFMQYLNARYIYSSFDDLFQSLTVQPTNTFDIWFLLVHIPVFMLEFMEQIWK